MFRVFNMITAFPLNLLLHSRAFLRLALVVERHLCLHASVNCNTFKKKGKRRWQNSFWDTELTINNASYAMKAIPFYLPQIFWVFFKVAPFSRRFSGPKDLHNPISRSDNLVRSCAVHTLTLHSLNGNLAGKLASTLKYAVTIHSMTAVWAYTGPSVLEKDTGICLYGHYKSSQW